MRITGLLLRLVILVSLDAVLTSTSIGQQLGDPSFDGTPPVGHQGHFLSRIFWDKEDDAAPINTDRPSFTPSSSTVPKGRVQVELGYTYFHDLSGMTRTDTHLFPELSGRIGINDWLELRTLWPGQLYSRTTNRFGTPNVTQNDGITNFFAGFKWHLVEQDGWVPETALITDLSIPLNQSVNSSESVDPSLFLIYNWSLTDRFSIAGSTGYSSSFARDIPVSLGTGDSFEVFSQSMIGTVSATDRVSLFYEWFVLGQTNGASNLPRHLMNGGFLFLLRPNLQLDFRAGFGLSGVADDFFTGAGLAFRY